MIRDVIKVMYVGVNYDPPSIGMVFRGPDRVEETIRLPLSIRYDSDAKTLAIEATRDFERILEKKEVVNRKQIEVLIQALIRRKRDEVDVPYRFGLCPKNSQIRLEFNRSSSRKCVSIDLPEEKNEEKQAYLYVFESLCQSVSDLNSWFDRVPKLRTDLEDLVRRVLDVRAEEIAYVQDGFEEEEEEEEEEEGEKEDSYGDASFEDVSFENDDMEDLGVVELEEKRVAAVDEGEIRKLEEEAKLRKLDQEERKRKELENMIREERERREREKMREVEQKQKEDAMLKSLEHMRREHEKMREMQEKMREIHAIQEIEMKAEMEERMKQAVKNVEIQTKQNMEFKNQSLMIQKEIDIKHHAEEEMEIRRKELETLQQERMERLRSREDTFRNHLKEERSRLEAEMASSFIEIARARAEDMVALSKLEMRERHEMEEQTLRRRAEEESTLRNLVSNELEIVTQNFEEKHQDVLSRADTVENQMQSLSNVLREFTFKTSKQLDAMCVHAVSRNITAVSVRDSVSRSSGDIVVVEKGNDEAVSSFSDTVSNIQNNLISCETSRKMIRDDHLDAFIERDDEVIRFDEKKRINVVSQKRRSVSSIVSEIQRNLSRFR